VAVARGYFATGGWLAENFSVTMNSTSAADADSGVGTDRGCSFPAAAQPVTRGTMIEIFCGAGGGLSAGFRTPECRAYPRALAAGVRKAPRHEIAVGGALAVPRALWGIERGVGLEENDTKRSSPCLWPEARVSLQG
jgi:hypothetical protein